MKQTQLSFGDAVGKLIELARINNAYLAALADMVMEVQSKVDGKDGRALRRTFDKLVNEHLSRNSL